MHYAKSSATHTLFCGNVLLLIGVQNCLVQMYLYFHYSIIIVFICEAMHIVLAIMCLTSYYSFSKFILTSDLVEFSPQQTRIMCSFKFLSSAATLMHRPLNKTYLMIRQYNYSLRYKLQITYKYKSIKKIHQLNIQYLP